jgi:hypothetical protein
MSDDYNRLKETESENYLKVNTRRRPDGSLYVSRKDMRDKYNNSILPYPFAAIFKLDYCWNVIKAHLANGLFFSIPLTFVMTYAINPDIRTKGFTSKSRGYYFKFYTLVYLGMITCFTIDSLIFCEYCKPWSALYTESTNSDNYKEMLKSRIKSEQKSNDVKYKRTRMSGLKDEEL